jgi:uncharacterized RDD family membrane protein YckC
MPLTDKTDFIVRGDDGEEYGPVDLAELREWVRENRAGLGTVVRPDRPDSAWAPWQNYPELVALLAEAEAQSAGTPAGPAALVIAPMLRRMAAFTIDLALAYVLLIPVILVTWLAFFPDALVQYYAATQLLLAEGRPFDYLPPDAVEITMKWIFGGGIGLYFAGFNWAHGQTPGKALLRLRVVDRDGKKPRAMQALARSIVVVFSLFFLGLPFLAVYFNPQRRGLHDVAAGTCVVEA